MYSRSTGEVHSNRVSPSLPRKWTPLPTHVYEVRALTFEVTDNFGSKDVLPCAAYGPRRTRGRYHGGRRPSSNDSLHSPTVIPPSALDKPSIMKRYHRRRTTRWGVTACSPTMVTLHDTWFVECRWWNDGLTVKTVVTKWSSDSMIPAPGFERRYCHGAFFQGRSHLLILSIS